ncbi:hypothetical protein GY45DRAFT_1323154 [Cubamyces sp. BRFM 1775]|nr:hypothetical protein GY45DRAFT_1323154 [Cubamyces sp. BRFM 1775]
MSALLSSTFWLLLNTPMIPPEHDLKAKRNVVPMVELGATASSHKRRRSRSRASVDSNASTSTSASESQPRDTA